MLHFAPNSAKRVLFLLLTAFIIFNSFTAIYGNNLLPVNNGETEKITALGPVIVSITSNTTVCAGEQISLSVSATGNGTLTYQWKKNR